MGNLFSSTNVDAFLLSDDTLRYSVNPSFLLCYQLKSRVLVEAVVVRGVTGATIIFLVLASVELGPCHISTCSGD